MFSLQDHSRQSSSGSNFVTFQRERFKLDEQVKAELIRLAQVKKLDTRIVHYVGNLLNLNCQRDRQRLYVPSEFATGINCQSFYLLADEEFAQYLTTSSVYRYQFNNWLEGRNSLDLQFYSGYQPNILGVFKENPEATVATFFVLHQVTDRLLFSDPAMVFVLKISKDLNKQGATLEFSLQFEFSGVVLIQNFSLNKSINGLLDVVDLTGQRNVEELSPHLCIMRDWLVAISWIVSDHYASWQKSKALTKVLQSN